ncbi:hypothetical protein N7474_001991 [Penicillium riverlandense]|uniref:uncharacterized protein n=1 Tax=Penicillium riverlandense TaxID=1903569 RepID=UPI00254701C1|nr:uncharacterized protein N7474_001991 [Penicillium riverlandense]KAJ5833680.1 hypothetical protein N7474_001991 [Penicillium riverlandense]
MSSIRAYDICHGTEDIALAPVLQNAANPTFLNIKNGTQFRKYVSDIGNATESEMVTIEYLCSYNPDTLGDLWLVNEEGNGVAQLTKDYYEAFGGPAIDRSRGVNVYNFSQGLFDSMLAQVKSDLPLQEEAQTWVRNIKDRAHAEKSNVLDKRFGGILVVFVTPSNVTSHSSLMDVEVVDRFAFSEGYSAMKAAGKSQVPILHQQQRNPHHQHRHGTTSTFWLRTLFAGSRGNLSSHARERPQRDLLTRSQAPSAIEIDGEPEYSPARAGTAGTTRGGYFIERTLDHKKRARSTISRVKWLSYNDSKSTWERFEHVQDTGALENYEQFLQERAQKPKQNRRRQKK